MLMVPGWKAGSCYPRVDRYVSNDVLELALRFPNPLHKIRYDVSV